MPRNRKPTPFKKYREGVLVTGRKPGKNVEWELWVQAGCRGHIYELTSRAYEKDGMWVQDAKCLVCFNDLESVTIDWWQEVATLNYVLAADVAISNRIKALEASQKILRRRQSKLSPREALNGF